VLDPLHCLRDIILGTSVGRCDRLSTRRVRSAAFSSRHLMNWLNCWTRRCRLDSCHPQPRILTSQPFRGERNTREPSEVASWPFLLVRIAGRLIEGSSDPLTALLPRVPKCRCMANVSRGFIASDNPGCKNLCAMAVRRHVLAVNC
jgi:hypothetical protein